jgi:hypothetical protein
MATRLPSLRKYSSSNGWDIPVPQLAQGAGSRVAPFCWRQLGPVDAASDKILTVIPNDPKKCIIALKNATFKIPDENPDDVRIDKAANPAFAFRQITVQARSARRGFSARLCGRRKDLTSQIVLKIENTDEVCLIEQRQAEN